MNFLDQAISFISPQAGLRRARARTQLQAAQHLSKRLYEGASVGRRTDGWITHGADANSEISSAQSILRARARDLVRNNPWASKAVKSLVSNVVSSGIIPRADTRTDEVWARWSDESDATGVTDIYGLQCLIARTMVESGAVLVRRRISPLGQNYLPIQLEVLEPDHLDTYRLTPQFEGNTVEQGIEFNPLGRRVGYWLYTTHPGSVSKIYARNPFESQFIPASEILHIYERLRPGQVNGVTWFAPAIIKMRDLDEYDEAELVRKKIEACLAAFVTTDDESVTLGNAELDENNRRIESFEPGMIEYLPTGRDVKFAEPSAAGGYAEYMRFQLHAIASAVDLTYELLTGDLSQVNFSSARVGLQEFRRRVKQVQAQILLPQFFFPVWRWFTDAAMAAGLLDARRNRIGVVWTMPRFEAIEPMKDATADLIRIRSGTLTLKEAIASHGYDPEDFFNEVEETNAILDEKGIILDSDPRKITQAGNLQQKPQTNSPGGGTEPDDDDDDDVAARWLAMRMGIPEHLLNLKPNGHAK